MEVRRWGAGRIVEILLGLLPLAAIIATCRRRFGELPPVPGV
jgi:hypothetical protein